jgi:hypothetical protein
MAEVARVQQAIEDGYRTPDGGPPLIMVEKPAAGASLV